jgi:hypothetical protein
MNDEILNRISSHDCIEISLVGFGMKKLKKASLWPADLSQDMRELTQVLIACEHLCSNKM